MATLSAEITENGSYENIDQYRSVTGNHINCHKSDRTIIASFVQLATSRFFLAAIWNCSLISNLNNASMF